MKSLILSLLIALTTTQLYSQVVKTQTDNDSGKSFNAAAYRLFPTQNMWNFIKLNTKTGQMWQVQFDVKGADRVTSALSLEKLVSIEKEVIDRFTLYSTQNIYTFILLDQIDGRTWQVQWSIDINNRGIIPIE